MGAENCVARGRAYLDDGDFDILRSTDWPSCNSIGLVLLLSRWGFAHRSLGGLADDRDRVAARAFLEGMFLAIAQLGGMTLLLFGSEVEWHPPRVLDGAQPFGLALRGDGTVDPASVTIGLGSPCALRLLEAGVSVSMRARGGDLSDGQHPISLGMVFESLWGHPHGQRKHAMCLILQLAVRLAGRFDDIVATAIATRIGHQESGVVAHEIMIDTVGNPNHRAQAIVAYWQAGIAQAKLHESVPWSVSVDATRVGKRNIQDACIVFPDIIAFWLPLQDTCRRPEG